MKKEIDLSEMHINLRTLWTTSYDKLPDWVDSENVIYKIENLVNGKVYIGQARNFYRRFVKNNFSHYIEFQIYCKLNDMHRHIYNSIRSHKSRNFEVSIIEICNSSEDLNNREIYWISYYHSYEDGYNMTLGGNNVDHLHSSEVRQKAIETQRKNNGGILVWNSPETVEYIASSNVFNSINKYLEWIKTDYPNKIIDWKSYWYNQDHVGGASLRNHIYNVIDHLPTLRKYSNWTPELEYIFSGFESHLNEFEQLYQDWLASAGQRSLDSRTKLYGFRAFDMHQCHTYNAIVKMRVSKLFRNIQYAINDIKKWHPDFKEITGDIYWHHMPYEGRNGIYHTIRVLELLPELRSDSRWTSEMEDIFSYIEIHRKEYGI